MRQRIRSTSQRHDRVAGVTRRSRSTDSPETGRLCNRRRTGSEIVACPFGPGRRDTLSCLHAATEAAPAENRAAHGHHQAEGADGDDHGQPHGRALRQRPGIEGVEGIEQPAVRPSAAVRPPQDRPGRGIDVEPGRGRVVEGEVLESSKLEDYVLRTRVGLLILL